MITYGATFICSPNVALGRVGPSGLVYDGQSFIDVAAFLNAVNTGVFNRGRGERVLAFSVWAFFASVTAAQAFLLTHEDDLALQADLTIECDDGATEYKMAAAAGQARIADHKGQSVLIEYKFTGAKFTLVTP